MFYKSETKPPKPPANPLPPKDPRVNFMRGEKGPFKCGNCKWFNGDGKRCRWVNEDLYEEDCCNQFWPLKGD